MEKLINLINAYKALTPLGKALDGFKILEKIDNIVKLSESKKQGNNCCTLRDLVSDILFIE